MADEAAENVGGISVSASIDDSKIEAELNALLASLRQQAEQAQIGIPVGVVGGSAGGRRAAAPQGPAVRIVGAGGSGGRSKLDVEDLSPNAQRQLAAGIAALGATASTAAAKSANQVKRSVQAAVVQSVSEAPETQATPIEIAAKFDTTALEAKFDALIEALQSKAAQEPITIPMRVATPRAGRATSAAAPVLSRDDRRLIELSYEAQRQQQQEIGSTGFAPLLSPAETARRRAGRARAEGAIPPPSRVGINERMRRQNAQFAAAVSTEDEGFATPGRRTAGGAAAEAARAQRGEDIERRARAAATVAITQAGTAPRTGRSQAAGVGGLSPLGVTRERIVATTDLAAKEKELTLAQRRLNVEEAKGPENSRAIRHAREELTVAQSQYGHALERVEKLSGAGASLRNLAAVTVAGAAFGIGLKAIDVALELTGKALDPVISKMLGFGNVAARVTESLADQTKQNYGNAEAVIAVAQAQAGLASSTARLIAPLLTEQVTIQAGNKNLGEAIAQFQTYQRIRAQGLQGIETGTGGPIGTGLFGEPGTQQRLAQLIQGLPSAEDRAAQINVGGRGLRGQAPTVLVPNPELDANARALAEGLGFANTQAVKGGESLLKLVDASKDTALADRTVAAAERGHAAVDFVNALRDQKIGLQGLSTNLAEAERQVHEFSVAVEAGSVLADQDVLRRQFNRQNPALIAAAGRQQQFALGTQLPAQAFLQRLAQPILPAGTGIAAANAAEAAKAATSNRETAGIQQRITDYQEQGRKAVAETYRPAIVRDFGQAAGQAFDRTLNLIEATGKQIAGIQASLSNEQAAYQVAQYNYQLQIAKRSLSDIGGLTGRNFGEGQSYLGILERQNLALSRQGQLLSFELNQRQINFQTAVAGFEAPGVTPAERQARIKEAQIEADFAQRQLNIQKAIFGNQVQIVDISNLRQGVDLAGQIGLLVQGRKVTFDTETAQQQLAALNTTQADLVNQVGVYFGTINSLTATGIGQIQQLEATAGQAMTNVAVAVLSQFGIFIHGLNDYVGAIGQSGRGGGRNQPINFQTGELFSTSRPTDITVGEAGSETVAVLRNPRQLMGDLGGGGGTIIIDVHDNQVRSDEDLERLARKIEAMMGRKASLVGLRPGG